VKKKLLILVVVILVVFFGLSRYQKSVLTVETTRVTRGDLVESVSASGEVSARELANMSFPTSGKVAYLGVADGDTVKKYQSLASLDKVLLDTAYQQALNMSRKYGATVDNIHDQLKNKSTTETFAEKDTRTTAEANNDYYYNALRAAEYNLKNASLIAPFGGVVTNLLNGLSVGANVTGGITVMTIVNPQSVYFVAEVSEAEIYQVHEGMKVKLTLDAYSDQEFKGVVQATSFGNYTSSTGGNVYKVQISLPGNTDFRFRLGMKGNAQIILKEHRDLTKTTADALIENTETYVWLLRGDKVEKRIVKTGVSSGDETEIIDGLQVDNVVLVTPSAKLKNGQRVRVK
jgi:RND family efflux transporter MFP subunit